MTVVGAIPVRTVKINAVKRLMSNDSFYFGVWDSNLGHYLRDTMGKTYWDVPAGFPWEPHEIDGRLTQHTCKKIQSYCGCGSLPEGVAITHHKSGWTAIGFWDRSADHRGASNGNFFFKGDHSFSEMLELAKKNFPHIMDRVKFDIVDGSSPKII